jgi:hypothetical protein
MEFIVNTFQPPSWISSLLQICNNIKKEKEGAYKPRGG